MFAIREWIKLTFLSHTVHFYKDCVKLIRILKMETLISLINSSERISVIIGYSFFDLQLCRYITF